MEYIHKNREAALGTRMARSTRGSSPRPIAAYGVNAPSVSSTNIAAIGGAVRISVVRIKPMLPCCSAWLLLIDIKS